MAAETTTDTRPGTMRLVDAIGGYRYPVMAIVSILHRVSGMLLFFLLPFIVWLFDASLTSEISYARFAALSYRNQGKAVAPRSLRQDRTEVRYLAGEGAFPPGVQPAYALKDGYLVFASSPEAVRGP